MRKLILLAVLLALAWWYFDGSRKMTEESIRTHYNEQLMALDRHDARTLCNGMASDFEGNTLIVTSEGSQRMVLDRDSACREITRGLEVFSRLGNASGGMLSPRIEMKIEKIELSIDRKTAVVNSVSTLKIGEMMIQRERSTDTLIRRAGRIMTQRGESKSWVYGN